MDGTPLHHPMWPAVYIAAIPGHTAVVPRAAGDIYARTPGALTKCPAPPLKCANTGRTDAVPRAAIDLGQASLRKERRA